MNTLFRGPAASRSGKRRRGSGGSRTLTRVWIAFVISMLLASMIPALANPVLAAPDAVDKAETGQETLQPVDSDGDGLTDDDEVNLHGTNPQAADSDQDGLSDSQEVQMGLNATNPDTDADGLPDGQDPDPFNAQAVDSDGDGITDDQEPNFGTDPNVADSDGDSLSDGDEVTFGTDPTNPDTDEDGTPDGEDDDPFNAPLQRQAVANGTIQARLLLCPPGTTTFPADETTCNLYNVASPGTFGLQPADVQIQTGGDGYAIFTEVAPGQVTLSLLTPPMNTPISLGANPYCTTDQPEQGQSNTKPYASASDSAITFELLSGETVNCLWFAIAQTGFDISNTKYVCPYGYDMANKSHEDLKRECDLQPHDVSFQVQVPQAQPAYDRTVQIDAQNTAFFEDVPAGQFTLREIIPPEYEFMSLWCARSDAQQNGQANGQLQYEDVTQRYPAGEVTGELQGGAFTCDWFNRELPTVIVILKVNCPADWTPQDMQTLTRGEPECTPPSEPVRFDVRWNAPTVQGDQTAQLQTNAEGVAESEQLPGGGEAFISEVVPDGYELKYIFCREVPLRSVLREAQPNQRAIEGTDIAPQYDDVTPQDDSTTVARKLRPGHLIVCIFVDVPHDNGTVVIVKLNCPEGWTPSEGGPRVGDFDTCTPPETPVTFDVRQGETTETAETVTEEGLARTRALDLPAGELTIQERVPDGYELRYIFCRVVERGPTVLAEQPMTNVLEVQDQAPGFESQTITENGVTRTIEGGRILICVFVDAPVEEYTVTVYKWQCEEGTLPGQPLEYYQGGLPDQDTGPCEMQQADVPFTLTHDGPDVDFMSDIDGHQESFVPDENGSFTITEGDLPGYGEPFRYCLPLNEPENGAAPPAWQTGGMGKAITVTVIPGEYGYQCWFYNIPEPEYTVTVYKWVCDEGTQYGNPDPSYYSAQCDMEQADVPFTLSDGNGDTPFTSDTNGQQLDGVKLDSNGTFTITEGELDGYGDPVRYCLPLNEPENGLPQPWQTLATSKTITVTPIQGEYTYQCWFYNIPWQDSTVTIRKWECAEGAMPDGTQQWYQNNCTTPHNGVEFTLTDSAGPRALTTAGGQVEWTDVGEGPVSISENLPPGWSPNPYVVCGWTAMVGGAVVDAFPMPVATINGVLNTTIVYPGTTFFCDWYNQYLGDGEITVYKYECPEGYDPHAWGANPMEDCAEALNGITFTLDQPDPEVDLQSDTGDSVNGAVYFGGLAPGDYTISEMVPPEYETVFVWDCVGINYSSVHPKPLSVGASLDFRIAGGDSIECYWFNVPTPQAGTMLVKKFNCTTQTYVSDVNCYTNTTGQAFDLQMWSGANWMTVQSGTTNVAGQLSFMDLEGGDYRLVEPGKVACLMKSSNITSGGNIGVAVGQQTTVYVYNCSSTPPPAKTPTKYPNTGAGPAADGGDLRTSHGASLLGMLGLAGTAVVSRRTFLRRAAVGTLAIGGGTVALNRAIASQTLVPLDATVTPAGSPAGTPAVDCLYPATPSATPEGVLPGTPVACARGAVPVQIRIETIGVDYPIEYLEIIEGEMQQPTGAEYIAWYKDTARLGEQGNGLYAGHLNWWNMPEGPFFLLETLVEGDVVELDGDDGQTYRYIVQWTQDFPIDEEPPEAALGPTGEEVITLITCGGEWNADVALYDHRTVVRAIRDRDFEPGATPPPGGTPPAAA